MAASLTLMGLPGIGGHDADKETNGHQKHPKSQTEANSHALPPVFAE